ncbi:hypothetical protein NFI96_009325 [Prochilodus magdalenae]|nr:hypothetical protein NFI96_009325 [Prochilodus magdalenae]
MEAYSHTGLPPVAEIPVYRKLPSELCQERHPPNLAQQCNSSKQEYLNTEHTCPVHAKSKLSSEFMGLIQQGPDLVMMSNSVASYDQLVRQVEDLRKENSHLRRELEDNSHHLSKLENETSDMKEVLKQLQSKLEQEACTLASSGRTDVLDQLKELHMDLTNYYELKYQPHNLRVFPETMTSQTGDVEDRAPLPPASISRARSPVCLSSRQSSSVSGEGTAVHPGHLHTTVMGEGRVTAQHLEELCKERTMLLSEIEKEERERHWYYSQLQGLSQRLAELPRIDTFSIQMDLIRQQLEFEAQQLRSVMEERFGTSDEMVQRTQIRVARLEQLEKELQEAQGSRGPQEKNSQSESQSVDCLSKASNPELDNGACTSSMMEAPGEAGSKVEMVFWLLSMLASRDREEMSRTLLAMSSSQESCIAMRKSGCVPLLPDEGQARREMRVLHVLEQIRSHCENGWDWIENHLGTPSPGGIPEPVDPQICQATCAIMKLSFEEEYRRAMNELGGLQAIAELMQLEQELYGMQNEPMNMALRRYGGMALTNLTYGDVVNKATLCSKKSCLQAIVALLASDNEELHQVVSSILRNLSWRADINSKRALRDVGSVSALMTCALQATKTNPQGSQLSARSPKDQELLWDLGANQPRKREGEPEQDVGPLPTDNKKTQPPEDEVTVAAEKLAKKITNTVAKIDKLVEDITMHTSSEDSFSLSSEDHFADWNYGPDDLHEARAKSCSPCGLSDINTFSHKERLSRAHALLRLKTANSSLSNDSLNSGSTSDGYCGSKDQMRSFMRPAEQKRPNKLDLKNDIPERDTETAKDLKLPDQGSTDEEKSQEPLIATPATSVASSLSSLSSGDGALDGQSQSENELESDSSLEIIEVEDGDVVKKEEEDETLEDLSDSQLLMTDQKTCPTSSSTSDPIQIPCTLRHEKTFLRAISPVINEDRTPSSSSDNYIHETPLVMSRCSSVSSLGSFESPSIASSIQSDPCSEMISGTVSPSDLPDSPGQTMPPSRSKTPCCAESNGPEQQNLGGVAGQWENSLRKFMEIADFKERFNLPPDLDTMIYFTVEKPIENFSCASSLSALPLHEHYVQKDVELKLTPLLNQQDNDPAYAGQRDAADDPSCMDQDQYSEGNSDDDIEILKECINSAMPSRFKKELKPSVQGPRRLQGPQGPRNGQDQGILKQNMTLSRANSTDRELTVKRPARRTSSESPCRVPQRKIPEPKQQEKREDTFKRYSSSPSINVLSRVTSRSSLRSSSSDSSGRAKSEKDMKQRQSRIGSRNNNSKVTWRRIRDEDVPQILKSTLPPTALPLAPSPEGHKPVPPPPSLPGKLPTITLISRKTSDATVQTEDFSTNKTNSSTSPTIENGTVISEEAAKIAVLRKISMSSILQDIDSDGSLKNYSTASTSTFQSVDSSHSGGIGHFRQSSPSKAVRVTPFNYVPSPMACCSQETQSQASTIPEKTGSNTTKW